MENRNAEVVRILSECDNANLDHLHPDDFDTPPFLFPGHHTQVLVRLPFDRGSCFPAWLGKR